MKMENKEEKVDIQIEFNYPEEAEQLDLNEYTVEEKIHRYSKFLGKKIPKIVVYFYCPRCSKKAELPQTHGDAFECGKCGLRRQSFGGSPYIWDDKMMGK